MNIPDESMFYTVFCVEPAAAAGYIITGIFTLERDAQAHAAECEARPRYSNSASVQRLPYEQIVTLLVKDRLRELADAIDRLVGTGAA